MWRAAKSIHELAGHADLSTPLRYMHLPKSHTPQAIHLLDHRGDAANEPFCRRGVEAKT